MAINTFNETQHETKLVKASVYNQSTNSKHKLKQGTRLVKSGQAKTWPAGPLAPVLYHVWPN